MHAAIELCARGSKDLPYASLFTFRRPQFSGYIGLLALQRRLLMHSGSLAPEGKLQKLTWWRR